MYSWKIGWKSSKSIAGDIPGQIQSPPEENSGVITRRTS